jgi:peptide/nickel transport system substrate-binding protein
MPGLTADDPFTRVVADDGKGGGSVSETKRRTMLGVVGAAVLALLTGCGGGRPPADATAPHAAVRGGQLVASIHADPRSFNRYVARDQSTDLLAMLTQGTLVRVNRSSFDVEPWLADRWEAAADGRSYVVHLRQGVTWSDGVPLTSADVVFSAAAVFDARTDSVLAGSLLVGGQPIRVEALDAQAVVVRFAAPSGPGIRILDNLPILPKHVLGDTLRDGSFARAWGTATPPALLVGTGPFVLREYRPGQQLVFERNPRYWRHAADGTPLPYLDRLVLEVVPDQDAEVLRLESGALDLAQDALRPEDYVAVRRAEAAGRVKMLPVGVSVDADAFWFCLKSDARHRGDPRFALLQKPEFRRALSYAIDRDEFARTVYLGEGEPVWGPVTPGNTQWFMAGPPPQPHDVDRAVALLRGIGLRDRNGDGIVEDAAGTPVRFSVITQRGVSSYDRGTTVLREQAARVGIALDIVPLEFGALVQKLLASDYDAIYMRPITTDLDPALNMDLWLSSGSGHFWNLEQESPSTPWERQIDGLMLAQASTSDQRRRHELFDQVQRTFADNVPAIYFAAPRMFTAHAARVQNVTPSVLRPTILWSADTIAVEPR